MFPSPRLLTALWVGKVAISINRHIGHGGTSLPGMVGRKIAPQVLSTLASQLKKGAIVVTGTNGKTTTSKMIAAIMEKGGLTLTHNRAGANLISGITTAFIHSASAGGQLKSDLGIIEVDEATVPPLTKEVKPRVLVVTNFFRDQLDRFGELDKTVDLVNGAIQKLPPQSTIILNADDPLVASLGAKYTGRVIYYGIESRSYGNREMTQSAETRFCRLCGHSLDYDWYFFGQLGHYRCHHCGFQRPRPHITIGDISLKGEDGSSFYVETQENRWLINLSTPGFYNIYNALAAVAVAWHTKVADQAIRLGLEGYKTNFGRMERLEIGEGRKAFLALIKNPTGCDEVIRTITQNEGPKRLLIMIQDNAADGRDISWLWDADFESLEKVASQLQSLTTSGLRGEDMALRLTYAGLPVQQIEHKANIDEAIRSTIKATKTGETLYILPTYTALLAAKTTLTRLGYSSKYWEE
ncbi:Mur ligase family protein [Heliorestis acidaminivorans]|uniref:Lipid II isoglutaminyl synthase (glutamine-hydrolyzing) subunit MurT n=1 Tax=Heliorestis acidaminivorans TaxID=553427 RepID=A0A6I0EXN2_9FIRM|nr:Mur ligase family protein [Heliorestis acidaminivorans]KAB2953050.1 Mur ligase family protein [Heliorestis acidaminivorans]